MKTLIDFMREHPVCFRKPSARMARAAGTWAERVKLTVPESADADRPRAEYPRPQLVRDNFEVLNGLWDFQILSCSDYVRRQGEPGAYGGKILVPFSPECDASGVGRILLPCEALICRTFFGWEGGGRLLLHFEAVDQVCEVFVNGVSLGLHEGGLPFGFDVTPQVRPGQNELRVCAVDLTDEAPFPRGKQSFSRGGIWYTPQSGIWGTVWTERVPERYVRDAECFADPDAGAVNVRLTFCGEIGGAEIEITDPEGGTLRQTGRAGDNFIRIPEPRLWSPDHPVLYDVRVRAGEDEVRAYFAFRKVELAEDGRGIRRIRLNGEFLFQSGVLDQGYYPESLLTPPSDEAMIGDIRSMKEHGFNMIRKHIKIEPARWYWHCDRLGMLVWQDMVSGGGRYSFAVTAALPFLGVRLNDTRHRRAFARSDGAERENYCRFVGETVTYLRRFPSIVTWCLFNEGWGQFDSAALTARVRELDGTRLIDSVSGWHDQPGQHFDFRSVHCYFRPFRMPRGERRCVVLSEFGGYALPVEGHMQMPRRFGYKRFRTPEELRAGIEGLYEREILPAVRQGLCACVYTQLSDVEEELNGILTYDRKVDKTGKDFFLALNQKLYAELRSCTAKEPEDRILPSAPDGREA